MIISKLIAIKVVEVVIGKIYSVLSLALPIATEFTVRYKMPERVEKAQQNGKQSLEFDITIPYQTLLFVEKRSIFLTKQLNQQIGHVLKDYLFKAYNGYIDVLNEAGKGQKTLDDVNSLIPEILGKEYQEQLARLEEMLAQQAGKILYGDDTLREVITQNSKLRTQN